MLRRLRDEGRTLLVVTARPRYMAETVLHHTGIDRYYQTVIGPAGSDRKADQVPLLNEELCFPARSGPDPFLKEHSAVVGDRIYPVIQ